MQVSIIIVNYNTQELLRNCLKSVVEQTKDISYEIIVSDNGSVDGSLEMVRQEFPDVVLLDNKANLGFGTANNRGLDVAKGECIFYLNSDTLLHNNAVKIFYDYWKAHELEGLGALGCNLLDADGQLSHSYGSFPSAPELFKKMVHHIIAFYVKNVMKLFRMDISRLRPPPHYEYKTGEVDYVTGADLFLRNSEDARFDETFFLYYEETDMQLKLAKKGLKRVMIDGPSVMHLVRGGKKQVDDVILEGSFSMCQSEISKVRYTKKHLSGLVAFFLKLMISLKWLSPYIFRNTRNHFKSLWRV